MKKDKIWGVLLILFGIVASIRSYDNLLDYFFLLNENKIRR